MMNRLLRLFAAVVVAASVVVLPHAPVQADPSACTGVLVVVDATAAGGDVTARCATGTPRTGLDALTAARFDYTFVPRIPGMVCQIDNRPDPCNNAPADAYWSYWQRDAQGPWRYATEGAGTSAPSAGGAEGWVFGAGNQPPDEAVLPADDQPPATTGDMPAPSAAPPSGDATATDNPPTIQSDEPATGLPETKDRADPANTDRVNAAAASQADTDSDNPANEPAPPRLIDRFFEEPRQLVGLLLLVIGVVALISAQRNRPKRPPQ